MTAVVHSKCTTTDNTHSTHRTNERKQQKSPPKTETSAGGKAGHMRELMTFAVSALGVCVLLVEQEFKRNRMMDIDNCDETGDEDQL